MGSTPPPSASSRMANLPRSSSKKIALAEVLDDIEFLVGEAQRMLRKISKEECDEDDD